jgi:hypothetical protein
VDGKHDFEAANDKADLKKAYLVDIHGILMEPYHVLKASLKVFNFQKRHI